MIRYCFTSFHLSSVSSFLVVFRHCLKWLGIVKIPIFEFAIVFETRCDWIMKLFRSVHKIILIQPNIICRIFMSTLALVTNSNEIVTSLCLAGSYSPLTFGTSWIGVGVIFHLFCSNDRVIAVPGERILWIGPSPFITSTWQSFPTVTSLCSCQPNFPGSQWIVDFSLVYGSPIHKAIFFYANEIQILYSEY